MAAISAQIPQALLPLIGHRLVALDPGSRCLKLLVAESWPGSTRLAHRQTIDTTEEGILAPEEVQEHLNAILPQLGPHSLAVVLPQHRCLTQVVDLPPTNAVEARKLLEQEAAKLSGFSENSLLFGYARLKPFGRYQNPYSLLACRSNEVWDQLNPFLPSPTDALRAEAEPRIWEVSTPAQALFTASQHFQPRVRNAVLVDLGASNTVVAILVDGQGVFATTFPVGSGHFTDALAKLEGCSLEAAENRKRSQNLFGGGQAIAGFRQVVQDWHDELRRSVTEWLEDNPELDLSAGRLPVFLCGGGACQPGLLSYLNGLARFEFRSWPLVANDPATWPMEQHWVAFGLALQALGKGPRSVSLLPADFRAERTRQRVGQKVQAANVLLIALLFLVLTLGTWQKARWIGQKTRLRTRTEAALQTAQTIDLLSRRLNVEYEQVRPVLHRQKQTKEILQALATLQGARGNKDYWYVLFADSASYATAAPMPAAPTNQTNLAAIVTLTNPPAARWEFVAELCIPQEGEEMRRVLSQVVSDLKQNPLFTRVDTLPAERRRNLVDPKVLLPNRHFALELELAGLETAPPSAAEGPANPPPVKETKRGPFFLRPKSARATTPGARTNE